MPRVDASLRRLLQRADTRAVAAIGGVLLVALALQGAALYAFVAEESLEQADHWLLQAREAIEALGPYGLSDVSAAEIAFAALPGGKRSVRLHTPGGEVSTQLGRWPEGRSVIPAVRRKTGVSRNLGSFRLLASDAFLMDTIGLPSGARLEIAIPLKRFAGEAHEIGRRIAVVFVLSGLMAFAIAIFATRRAFAPLREATTLLEGLDARSLGRRVRSRHTGDPVDRHAETLNAVLASIDSSFSRLRSFSSDVAHEIRTPLNRMRNVAEVALAGGDPAEQRLALERVEQSIDELSRLVDSLLLIAEADDRRVPLQPEVLDGDAWLASTAEAYGPLFEEHGAKLSVESRIGRIAGDRALLDRVLGNLLENALQHGASGGRVEISGERDVGAVCIAVDDAGPGIPAAEQERVFERFARLDRTRRGSSGGLGLALARAVARLLGGDLALETSRLGGARFVWRLPAGAERGSG